MRRHLWWALGLVLVCGGVVVTLTAQAGPDDFGWFAYTPLSDDPDWYMGWSDPISSGTALIVTRWQVAGSAAVALGLAVIAGGAGYRLGRRRVRREDHSG
jgi:heme/copper-type cytochrome/quinol oxidase subunit 1